MILFSKAFQPSRLTGVAFFVLQFLGIPLHAQHCDSISTLPFQIGEQVEYSLVYQMGMIWLPAGKTTFTVGDTLIGGDQHFQFVGEGHSLESWDWFYEVASTYSSIADSNLTPVNFTRRGLEGSYVYDRTYDIEVPDSVHYFRRDPQNPEKSWSYSLDGLCAHDVMTAVYHVRSLPFDDMKAGDRIPLNLILDGDIYPTYVRYEGKKVWKDGRTGKKYNTLLLMPNLIEGTVFRSGEGMKVYVSDDNRRIPLYIETKLIVGKARIYLTGGKGLLPRE